MVPDEGIVTTDVDALIRVVQEKKEVSVPDVAKELEVPEATIEAWATFLEEEGILEIRYKFTKPFLVAKKEGEVEAPKKEAKPKIKEKGWEKEAAEEFKKKAKEEKLPPAAKKELEKPVEEAKKIVKEAKEEIGKGEIEKARELYHKLKDEYEHLPDEYASKKDKLITEMVELNEKLIDSIDKFAHEELQKKTKKINALIKKSKKLLRRKKFDQATAAFTECKEILAEMPEGFLEEKTLLQESLLKLHDDIVRVRTSVHTKEVKEKIAEINKIIANGEKAMLREDTEAVEKSYHSAKEVLKSLPEGFVKEKLALHDVITSFHDDLIEMQAEISRTELEARKHKLTKLLDHVEAHLKKNNASRAAAFYEEAQKSHTELPMSFLEKESTLEKRFITLGKNVAKAMIKFRRKEMKEKTKKFNNLLSAAKRYIRRKEPELGAKVYTDMVKLYNELPKGFIDEKTKLRRYMLNIYEKTVLASDRDFLQAVDDKIKKRYNELLSLLVTFQKHIDDKTFTELDKDVKYINKVYEGLPIAFLRQKLKLIDEVTRANDLLVIHQKSKLIKQIPATRYKELKGVLDDIYKLYNKIVRKYPEENELLKYVKDTSAPYSLKLAAKGMIKKSHAGLDLKKELARIKKEKEAEKAKRDKELKLKAERKKLLKEEAKAERERILEHIEKAKAEELKHKKDRAELLEDLKKLRGQREKLLKEQLKLEQDLKKEKQEQKSLRKGIRTQEEQIKDEFGELEAAKLKMQLRSGELKALKQKYAETSKLYNELKSKRKKASSKILLESIKREKKKLARQIKLQKAEQKKLELTKQQQKFMKEVEELEEHKSFLKRFFGIGKKKTKLPEIEEAPKEEFEKIEKKAEKEQKKAIQHLAKELKLKQEEAEELYSQGAQAVRQARKDTLLKEREENVKKIFNKRKLDITDLTLSDNLWEEWALMQALGLSETDLTRLDETTPFEKVERMKKKHRTTHDVALMLISEGKKAETQLKKLRKNEHDLTKQLTRKCKLSPTDAKVIAKEGSELANEFTLRYESASYERKINELMKKHELSREGAEVVLKEGPQAKRMLKQAEVKLGEEEKDIIKELHVGREEADILLTEGRKAIELVRGSEAEKRRHRIDKILERRGIDNKDMLYLIEETPNEEKQLMSRLRITYQDLENWREATPDKKLASTKKKHRVTKEMALIIANMGKIALNELKNIRKEHHELARLLVKEHKLSKPDAHALAREGKELVELFVHEHQKELHEKQLSSLMKHHGLSREGAELVLEEGEAAKKILKEAEKKIVVEKKATRERKIRKTKLQKIEDQINEKLASLSKMKPEEAVIISRPKALEPSIPRPSFREVAKEKPKPKKPQTKTEMLQRQQEEIERKLASLSK